MTNDEIGGDQAGFEPIDILAFIGHNRVDDWHWQGSGKTSKPSLTL